MAVGFLEITNILKKTFMTNTCTIKTLILALLMKFCSSEIGYKLVVVCSIERENHSRIVAALDKYRRPPLPLMTHDNMVKYIKDKLTFDIKKPAATPAAEADFEQ
jgi:hypothetical protein